MMEEHYSPYSKKRIKIVVQVLKKYNLDLGSKDIFDMLISEAKIAQIQCDYFAPLKNAFKALATIIVPIVVFVAQKLSEAASQEDMLTMALQSIILILLVFSIMCALASILKDIIYRDYNRYNDFISDLQQLKIFYSTNKKIPPRNGQSMII